MHGVGERVTASGDFEAFGPSHVGVLVVLVVGAIFLVMVGRRHRDMPGAERFSRGFAVLIPVFTVPLQVFQLLPGEWDLDTSLPLNLCDLAWVVAAVALWTRRRWVVGINYYWGLTLTMQAVLTPDLGSEFPDPRFLLFWAMHLLIVWSAVYLTWGLRIVPGWREYRIALYVTLAWAGCAMTFNGVVGTNYGFLNGKPSRASALDLLGPWPLYVVAEVAIVLTGWALITWPWVRADSRARRSS